MNDGSAVVFSDVDNTLVTYLQGETQARGRHGLHATVKPLLHLPSITPVCYAAQEDDSDIGILRLPASSTGSQARNVDMHHKGMRIELHRA